MKKYLHALVFALLGLTAQAQQSTPAITLTAEVDGTILYALSGGWSMTHD